MRALPLFHRIAGRPVIVLGEGAAAEAKRRLVTRAGGTLITHLDRGIAEGARLAFVAEADPAAAETAAARLREAGLLVNVADRPELCDFTTPSVLDRDPVLVAVGSDGASAGLAKQLRLRLEGLLPARLGELATALHGARDILRARWPDAGARRRALDAALAPHGPLDPLADAAADRVPGWLERGGAEPAPARVALTIASDDPDELTLRAARLLGTADCILFEPGVAPAILDRARADAVRLPLPHDGAVPSGLVVELRLARPRD